jgi:hypothetical protein
MPRRTERMHVQEGQRRLSAASRRVQLAARQYGEVG